MDPGQLLEVPMVSNPVYSRVVEEAKERGIVWGHDVEYKPCYLDTVPDNKKPVLRSAPWPATPRFRPSDGRDQNAKYDDAALGTKPMSLPYARVVSTGLREPGTFPAKPHTKDPVDGAQVTVKPHMLKEPRSMLSLSTADIDGAISAPKLGPERTQPTSPLEPRYSVASHTVVPIPEPRFLRDSIPCEDISGDRRIKLFATPRESATMYCDDISGTRTKNRIRERTAPYNPGAGVQPPPLYCDTLEGADIYNEINRLPYRFRRTSRNVNPMEPKYRYNVPNNDPLQGPMLGHKLSGERPGVVPKEVSDAWTLRGPEKVRVKRFATGAKFLNYPGPLHDERPGPTQLPGDVTYREYMLRSEDIEGAQHGTKGRFQSRTSPFYRTQEGVSNQTADIEKAQPRGHFTLLPAHILTRRLAESMQSGAATARENTSFAGFTNPQSKRAWAEAGGRPDSARGLSHLSKSEYRKSYTTPPTSKPGTAKPASASASKAPANPPGPSQKQASELQPSVPSGPAPQAQRPSTVAISSELRQQPLSMTPRVASAAGVSRDSLRGASTPRGGSGKVTPRAGSGAATPRAAALNPKLLAALASA